MFNRTLQHLAVFASLRELSFIRSSPFRAKPVLSPSFVRINSAEGMPRPQRKTISYFSELGALCPVGYPFHRSVIFSFTALFPGASPVEYRLDQDRVVCPKRYSTGRVIFSPILLLISELCALCGSTLLTTLSPSKGAFARVILYPIFSSIFG